LRSGAEAGDRESEARMNVEEAMARVAQMPEGSVLVAKPPLTWGAEAMFIELTDDYRVPQAVKDAGYEYLLGRDDIANLLAFLKKKKVSSRTVAEFIIHYAVNDCAPAWINDVPDV
jgi:hypothetical protein